MGFYDRFFGEHGGEVFHERDAVVVPALYEYVGGSSIDNSGVLSREGSFVASYDYDSVMFASGMSRHSLLLNRSVDIDFYYYNDLVSCRVGLGRISDSLLLWDRLISGGFDLSGGVVGRSLSGGDFYDVVFSGVPYVYVSDVDRDYLSGWIEGLGVEYDVYKVHLRKSLELYRSVSSSDVSVIVARDLVRVLYDDVVGYVDSLDLVFNHLSRGSYGSLVSDSDVYKKRVFDIFLGKEERERFYKGLGRLLVTLGKFEQDLVLRDDMVFSVGSESLNDVRLSLRGYLFELRRLLDSVVTFDLYFNSGYMLSLLSLDVRDVGVRLGGEVFDFGLIERLTGDVEVVKGLLYNSSNVLKQMGVDGVKYHFDYKDRLDAVMVLLNAVMVLLKTRLEVIVSLRSSFVVGLGNLKTTALGNSEYGAFVSDLERLLVDFEGLVCMVRSLVCIVDCRLNSVGVLRSFSVGGLVEVSGSGIVGKYTVARGSLGVSLGDGMFGSIRDVIRGIILARAEAHWLRVDDEDDDRWLRVYTRLTEGSNPILTDALKLSRLGRNSGVISADDEVKVQSLLRRDYISAVSYAIDTKAAALNTSLSSHVSVVIGEVETDINNRFAGLVNYKCGCFQAGLLDKLELNVTLDIKFDLPSLDFLVPNLSAFKVEC